jgi:O-succinylbenzoic acid--CoA ligase
MVTGTEPAVLDLSGGFTPAGFAAAARALRGARRYTALVPTQLVRLIEDGGEGLRELARFDAVLVGGAGTAPSVLNQAAIAGVRVVTTYGASETCGGCVYDGVPLDGVCVRIEPAGRAADGGVGNGGDGVGRIVLGGPTLARGYRGGDPEGAFATDEEGRRWWRTADAGRRRGGRLEVLGRLDEAVLSGGVTVMPAAVEAALLALPGVAEAVVTGVDDPQWGQRVVAAIVPPAGTAPPTLAAVRTRVAAVLGPYAAPRQLLVLDALPLLGVGKPDRAAVARRAAAG